MRGSCREATEGANWARAALAPSGPLGHLPRIAGEDLSAKGRKLPAAYIKSPTFPANAGIQIEPTRRYPMSAA